MKPQPYNRKKRFYFELSRTQMFFSIAGGLVILSWVFVLGIIVGRGYVSDTITRAFSDQIQKLQQEKKALTDKYLAQGKKTDVPQEEILKPQLDFYNKLSQKDTGNTKMIVPQPTPQPAPGERKAETTPKPPDSVEAKKESKVSPPEAKVLTEAKASKESSKTPNESETFLIQISSYREEDTARSSVKRLKEKGYSAFLRAKEIPEKGGKWFRVQVGPFKSKEDAEKIIKKLGHDGFQGVLLEKKE